MLRLDMTATVRQGSGKGAARSLRREGKTPAILYGVKAEPVALSLESALLRKILMQVHGRNAVVSLAVEADGVTSSHHVMVREIQKDPVTEALIHVDFFEISLDKERVYSVPLNCVGVAKGVDLGGFMNVVKPFVHVKGLPLDIPDTVDTDVSALNIGDAITCQTLSVPDSVTLLEDAEAACVMVTHLKQVVEETTEEEEVEEEGAPAAEEGAAEEAAA
ncbi:MAG: 50S ribosomal protein L25 [Desulfobacterales bacterium]|nr:50S ribosomal protein L25 [Desulfobacterales bacterium]